MVRASGSGVVVLVAVLAGGVACSARNLVNDVDAGPRAPGGGQAGQSGVCGLCGDEVLSNFEGGDVARVVRTGTPPRDGVWYSFNDMSATCVQDPLVGAVARASTPPAPSPLGGGLALHTTWSGCSVWGAGVGADFNLYEVSDGGASIRQPYDITGYRGITFWAMAAPGSDTWLRLKVVMRAETRVEDGGQCVEAVVGVNKCGDSWGQTFSLPSGGTWRQVTVLFADTSRFKQEGWGAPFPWRPTDAFGIQIQSQGTEFGEPFDFWIDDLYLIR